VSVKQSRLSQKISAAYKQLAPNSVNIIAEILRSLYFGFNFPFLKNYMFFN